MLTNKQIWRRCVSYNSKKKEQYYMRETNNYVLSNERENNRKIKKIQFNSSVSVVLIPGLSDYLPYMKRLLWYDNDDYVYFRKELLKNEE